MNARWIYLSFILLILLVGWFLYFTGHIKLTKSYKSDYSLVYCMGHSDTVGNIKIENEKVIEPERSGHLKLAAYDYDCFIRYSKGVQRKVSIAEINKMNLIYSETSPDGYYISKESRKTNDFVIGGLFVSKIYLESQADKILIDEEAAPVNTFKSIGWTK